ncbi:MAG: flavodoxin family protein [Deltaproteobacteria bacterium]|jgi:multimeric flavodoxin WrbA|nr:flavodoxin family protein [Deltaproteobacteria bacterium]
MVDVIAFSGSPIKNGNIEKGLQAVLAATGLETELVRLVELDMRFCVGCKRCADLNRCVFDDDVNPILDKIEKARGLIFSAYPSFSSVNALTKCFIERNWPLRHNRVLTQGKVGAAVICGRTGLDELAEYFETYFVRYLLADFQGTLKLEGNVPCLSCGFGESCPGSGFLSQHGPGAKITPDKFRDFGRNPVAQSQAAELGRAVGRAVRGG